MNVVRLQPEPVHGGQVPDRIALMIVQYQLGTAVVPEVK